MKPLTVEALLEGMKFLSFRGHEGHGIFYVYLLHLEVHLREDMGYDTSLMTKILGDKVKHPMIAATEKFLSKFEDNPEG